MVTYNHEKFIARAIQSVLDQEYDKPIELIIGDDASTDNTPQIIESIAKKYPGKINPVLRSKNIGGNRNYIDCFKKCRGTYIAVCEGDDYWTDPLKVKKQVDFLNANPSYSICFTNTEYLDQSTGEKKLVVTSKQRTRTITDLFKGNFIATQTVMYRNVGLDIPPDFVELKVGDWPLHILHAQFGQIGHLEESTAVYRIHENNNWSGIGSEKKVAGLVEAAVFLSKNVRSKYRPMARKQALRYIHYLVDRYNQEKNFTKAQEKSKFIYQIPWWWFSPKSHLILFKTLKR